MSKGVPCDQLSDLLKHDPTAADRGAVAAHIASCPVCQKIITGSLGTVDFRNSQTTSELPWKVIDATVEFEPSALTVVASRGQQSGGVQVPGYEVLAELGRGGMGVVYKARQVSLDRLVALKMIRSAAIADANQLARFNMEAAALAQLQHPNIVQVFAIGQHDDMPYLAMEFVPGETLASAMETRSFSPRDAAALVEKLAKAMFSAHQRGVLHRDLKPANVLLSADGEPKITDFGLAKRVGGESQLTVDHTVMGTPSYMPPEQAHGHIAEIGPRSDVYSLGAILYELLTGRPPFRGTTPLDTIQQVIQREPTAPRTINPRIPPDLETICLKCLHKLPVQRYDSAADLADDLRRFHRNEPILARRISLFGRGWRWCRRNPALSAAMLATCLAVLLGIAGVAWQTQKAERASQRVARESQKAERASQRYAGELNEKFGLIQDLMERVPEEERAQNDPLQTALSSIEKWLAEEPADDKAKTSYADALFRVADIRRRIGQFDLAEESFLKARDRHQQLAIEAPDEPEHLHGLAETLNWLGENYRESGKLEKAIETYDEAGQYQTKFAQRWSPDSFQEAKVARLLYNRALALRNLNRAEEAEMDLRQSIVRLERSRAKLPKEATFRQGLARSQINLGIVLSETERPKAANDEYLSAIELLNGLEQEFPRNAEYRLELATVLMNRANLLLADQQRMELGSGNPLLTAEELYRVSVDKLQNLSREYSNVPRYRKELANSLNGLGVVLMQLGQNERAEHSWVEAMKELKSLVTRSPSVAEYYVQLAQTTNNLAYLHRGDPDATKLELFRREAVDQQRKAAALSPTNVLYAKTLRNYQRSLSRLLVDRGNHADAAEVARQFATHSADDGPLLYAAAKVLAQCAVVAEQDPTLDASRRAELVQRYRSQATELVATCRQQGLAIKPEDFPSMETVP